MLPDNFSLSPRTGKLILAGLVTFFAVVLVRTAWLCDDAYITFRVVDNFVNGYGPVWNVAERVQVFTHPLWMLLLSAIYFFTREIYFTSLVVSILIGLATVYVVAFKISDSMLAGSLALLALIVSKAFVEYTTSGLENTLTFLLLAIFFWDYLKSELTTKRLLTLAFIAGLGVLNRYDMVLIYLPPLLYAFSKADKKRGAFYILTGFSPLIIWLLFSLVYYGFLLPNTFYAKTNTGIPAPELWLQGLKYILFTLQHDPVTILLIVAGLVSAFRSQNWKLKSTAVGIVLYLLYIIKVGGDFMGGRFLAAPMLCALSLVVSTPLAIPMRSWSYAAATIVIYGLLWPGSALISGRGFGDNYHDAVSSSGIADERRFYYRATGLLMAEQNKGQPNFKWFDQGQKWRSDDLNVQKYGAVGFCGFAAGVNVHIIDEHALTDPLLARMPVYNNRIWRIGHFKRMIPNGYLETLNTSASQFDDSSLSQYYNALHLITAGGIFESRRITEIIKMNLGQYDQLLENYLSTAMKEIPYDSINVPKRQGTMWRILGNATFNHNGLRVLFDSTCYAEMIEISVDNNDRYSFEFYNAGNKLGTYLVDSLTIPSGGLRIDTVVVPDSVHLSGFNMIEIHPEGGDECFCLGHALLLPTIFDSAANDIN